MASGFVRISLQMDGQQELIGRLKTWGARVDDLTAAWEDVGEHILLRDFALQFENEGGYLGPRIGPKWAPLRPATLADRARKGFPPEPILERTGMLRQSVTERGTPGNVFLATHHGITVGTYYPVAMYHQYGTGKHKGRQWDFKQQRHREMVTYGMPPRVMIGLKWSSRSEIIRLLQTYVTQMAHDQGLA